MQLCYLLLPQQNRLRLHRLLRFISKASTNPQLRLSSTQSNAAVLSENLGPAILRRCATNKVNSKDDDISTLVAFMVEHYRSILKVGGAVPMQLL